MSEEPDTEKIARELLKLANGMKYLSIAFSIVAMSTIALIAIITLPPIIWAWIVEHSKWIMIMTMFITAVVVHAIDRWDGK